MAVDAWNVDEAALHRDDLFGAPPGLGANQDELLTYIRRQGAMFERLTFLGEAVLMFAEAATNALAEAVFGSWGITAKRRSLFAVAEGVGVGRYQTQEPNLSIEAERLWAVYLGVNLPRHVLAVHPPEGSSANSFLMGTPIFMGWNARWDADDPEWKLLSARVRDETSIPDDMAGTPDRLVAWVIDQPQGLSSESREMLQRYAKKHGIYVSPVRAAAKVQALVRDVAEQFGYHREDFFSE
jgi:hypothetical protein